MVARVTNQRIPSYRCKIIRGQARAIVQLTDSESRARKDFLLGAYGTAESRAKYARLIAEWESNARRLPETAGIGFRGVTVAELCWEFWISIQGKYCRQHLANFKIIIRLLRSFYGDVAAGDFGPNALRLLREEMLAGERAQPAIVRDEPGQGEAKPRKPWTVKVSNRFCRYIVQIFRWGVARELIKPDVLAALRALEPLRADLALARPKVSPAPLHAVRATRMHVGRVVCAMIDLQLVTGMRPGEVCRIRVADIDMTERVWTYRALSKMAHIGQDRVVYLGPRAQEIIRPFIADRPTMAYLFSPREAVEDRYSAASRATPAEQGNRRGYSRAVRQGIEPSRPPRPFYSSDTYRRAITRGCDLANEAAIADARAVGKDIADGVRLIPRWHPHQLRHNYATEIRKRHGLEAAAILLGHSSALVTEAVYAERDMTKAMGIAAEIG